MSYDAIDKVEGSIPEIPDDPNDRYISNTIKIKTLSDADSFCNTYNHDNGYNGLKIGQTIQIYYNSLGKYDIWLIAGFDCEYNHTASDGTIKDNGYGICLICNSSNLIRGKPWNDTNTATPYISSTIHTSTLQNLADDLKITFGSHLINRNVLLSSSIDGSTYNSISYTWTKAYCTLPSVGQLNGKFGQYKTIYDDGEANYQLPICKYPEFMYTDPYIEKWTRNVTKRPYSNQGQGAYTFTCYSVGSVNGRPNIEFQMNNNKITDEGSFNVTCPIIYIR